MKIALITDTHWGVRNDNVAFHDSARSFLEKSWFPRLDADGIRHVIHLGDLVDRRKYVNFLTAKRLREDFLDPLAERGIETHIILGNHDTYYKNTNDVNALFELVNGKYNNITVYDRPRTVRFDQCPVLMLPWICEDNYDESMDAIKNEKAQVVMGHLELNGFEMFKGSVADHGMDHRIFDRFDVVCSGHYHHKSTTGNINYLGASGEYTWSDYDDPRGFHIFDTETLELTFVENPYKMFKKVWYNDLDKVITEVLDHDFEQYKNKIVKVIVTNKTNPYWFDMFIERLEKVGVIDMQIVEDHLNLSIEEDSDIVNEAESTLEIFRKYIGQFNLPDTSRIKLETTITELYNEALTIE